MQPDWAYPRNGETLEYDGDACIGCGRCETVCPHGVFVLEAGKAAITRRGGCMECGACKRNCPVGAIDVRAGVGCATGILASMAGVRGICCSEGCGCGE